MTRGRCIALSWGLVAALGACGGDDIAFIPGTGELPSCDEAPATELGGSTWYYNGTLTVLSEGCPEHGPGVTVDVCALQWAFSQTGNDVAIVSDNEYRLDGRLCGDRLYVRGGFWLALTDDDGNCTYRDEDGTEVRIQAEGNVLELREETSAFEPYWRMEGTLRIRERCDADLDVVFSRLF